MNTIKNNEAILLLKEKKESCVSVIVPVHRLSPERMIDPASVKTAVKNAMAFLRKKYENDKVVLEDLLIRLNDVESAIDYSHLQDDIGIYVSPGTASLVQFPFPVKGKIRAGETFDARDLLFKMQLLADYYVLSVSKKNINLFKGCGQTLEEIKNDDFPVVYKDTYAYSRPVRATSFSSGIFKGFERDKSPLMEIRLKRVLRSVDASLKKYLGNSSPLVISGGKKEINDFMSVTHSAKNIIGKVFGNYHFNGDQELAFHSWEQVKLWRKKENDNLLSEFRELTGKEMVAIGLEKVWEAACAGNCLELVVEKDYEMPGFIINNGLGLKLKKPASAIEHVYMVDAVEPVIRKVLEKGGKVIFMENDMMMNSDLDKIALRLRYVSSY